MGFFFAGAGALSEAAGSCAAISSAAAFWATCSSSSDKQAYPGRDAVRVSALPEAVADEKATPAGSFAFRLAEVTKVVGALRGVLVELIGAAGTADTLREQCEAALVKAKLKPAMILNGYMKPFGSLKPKSK